ncbi:MAG: hypothetical protein ABS76_08065 [Pelagibacterium sp. SCN 64-44]|nr:MAG: hypothetical protein ABS76_08065 [Pelagibacterium sp. SCN 64-44]
MTKSSASKWRRLLLDSSVLRLALGLFLIWGIISGQSLAGWLTQSGRVADDIPRQGPVNVVVALDFEPERFHNEQLGSYGVFSGRDGDIKRFRLRNVSQKNLEALSQLVWISRIELLK